MASFDEVIPPGQAGKISAALKTEGIRGRIEKSITVTSSDPIKTTTLLRVRAEVVGSVEFVPRPGLAFPEGMDWSWSTKLIVRKDKTETGELRVTDVTSSVPWLTAKATKVAETLPAAEGLPEALPGDYILDVSVTDEAPRTQGGFTIRMKTGLPREPEVTLPVSVVNQVPMRPIPNALYLEAPKPGSGELTATIEARLRPGLTKETVTATASPEPFSVRVEPDGERKFRATVTWNPGKDGRASAPRQGAVVLRVGEESVTVPVRINPDPPTATQAVAPSSGSGGQR